MKVQTKLASVFCATVLLMGCEGYYDRVVTISGSVSGECSSAAYCRFVAQDGTIFRVWNAEPNFKVHGDNVCLSAGISGTKVYPMHFVPKMLCGEKK